MTLPTPVWITALSLAIVEVALLVGCGGYESRRRARRKEMAGHVLVSLPRPCRGFRCWWRRCVTLYNGVVGAVLTACAALFFVCSLVMLMRNADAALAFACFGVFAAAIPVVMKTWKRAPYLDIRSRGILAQGLFVAWDDIEAWSWSGDSPLKLRVSTPTMKHEWTVAREQRDRITNAFLRFLEQDRPKETGEN